MAEQQAYRLVRSYVTTARMWVEKELYTEEQYDEMKILAYELIGAFVLRNGGREV